MEAEIGLFALILALVVATAQVIVPLIGAYRRDSNMMNFANHAAVAQVVLIALAFGCLTYAFVMSDFSLLVVTLNSNSQMPLLYRYTAVWGNHEGSLLLWVFILAIFGAGVALTGKHLPATLKARVLAVQAGISWGFLALMILTTNPFERLNPAAMDGQELNPLLQDIGLAIHPPFLYLGYVGFSITFAFAIAALMEGRVDAAWARFVRPWVLAAWCFLTMGIALGSYWAYYELGWGGWWFWDPVENASLMPWIVGTALLHSALVVEKRQALVVWTILLAILTFSLSLIGTFLVRSGVLTSVHAFATAPGRGIGVLIMLAVVIGGGLTLFAIRSGRFNNRAVFGLVSREGGLVVNNILLVTIAGTVFLGTFYPLIIELLNGEKISVGAPYFNQTFGPLMVVLSVVLVLGPMLRWKRDNLKASLIRVRMPALLALLAVVMVALFAGVSNIVPALGLGLAAWLVFGSLLVFAVRMRLFTVPAARSWQLLKGTPRATTGMVLAHIGLGLLVAGVASVTAWEQERILSVPKGETIELAGFAITVDDVSLINGPNYEAERGLFTVRKNGEVIANMSSERRFYPVSQRVTTEAGISPRFMGNIYIALGEEAPRGSWVVRIYWHPLVLLIWIGPLLMALGGFISLSDRRFRIGAPQKSRNALPKGVAA